MSYFKYKILLFCNKKKIKTFYKSNSYYDTLENWKKLKTVKKPKFIIEFGGKRNMKPIYEIGLIGPNSGDLIKTYNKDSLGRSYEVTADDPTLSVRKIYPYWKEELIYDYQTKKRIRYHILLEEILKIKDLSQIFILNKNLFIQTDNHILMYGNKNTIDALRLLELIRTDILNEGVGNFIFIKDVTTHQRKLLYTFLSNIGFDRSLLFRHYSY